MRVRIITTPTKALSTAALLSLFTVLGFWQLDRAREKLDIQARMMQRSEMAPIEVGRTLLEPDRMVFRKAVARGHYVADGQILLDNIVHRGRAGYHVLTPLMLSGANTMLIVNRGWAPWGADRQAVPRVAVPSARLNVTGILSTPLQYAIDFEDDDHPPGLGQVWQSLDIDHFQTLTGNPVQRLVLLLDPEEGAQNGLIRDWPTNLDYWIPRHRAYAVQWFGLALALAVIFTWLSIKRGAGTEHE